MFNAQNTIPERSFHKHAFQTSSSQSIANETEGAHIQVQTLKLVGSYPNVFKAVERPIAVFETREFKNWFDQSKIVNRNSEPLVVYHGTRSDFETFDREYQNTGKLGKGFYFSPSIQTANLFAKIGGLPGTDSAPKVLPVYLSIKNPASFNFEDMPVIKIDQGRLIEQGYDGAIMYKSGEIKEIAAFEPTQIKSAIGNNGQFDPLNPRIDR